MIYLLCECGYKKCKKCQEKIIFKEKREYFYCKLCGTKNDNKTKENDIN